MVGNGSPRVIHLAAGEGTRLRPITNDRPKPLVELADRSLLERNLETFADIDVTDQIIVTGYCADQIEPLGYKSVHNPDFADTDMVYSLFCAEHEFPTEQDLVIAYGDIVYAQRVVESLVACRAPVGVVVDLAWQSLWEARFNDPLNDAETLKLDAKNRITEIGGVPDSLDEIDAQYVGLIKIDSDYIDQFKNSYHGLASPENDGGEAGTVEMTQFIQQLIDDQWWVEGVPIEGGWLEVDTTEDLQLYQDAIRRNESCPHINYLT